MGYAQEAKLAIDKLNCLVEGEYMSGYEIVSLMPNTLLEAIEGGAYALGAENDYKTTMPPDYDWENVGWCDLDGFNSGD